MNTLIPVFTFAFESTKEEGKGKRKLVRESSFFSHLVHTLSSFLRILPEGEKKKKVTADSSKKAQCTTTSGTGGICAPGVRGSLTLDAVG